MNRLNSFGRVLGSGTLLFALGLFHWSGGPLGAQAGRDAVEELRQALRIPAETGAQAIAARKEFLTKRIDALQGPGELRRALLLHEWGDEEPGADTEVRGQVIERFETILRQMMHNADPSARLAAATLIGDTGLAIRANASRRAMMRDLTPDLVALLEKDAAPEVRVAAARALGNITPEPNAAVPALDRALSSGGDALQRAAATALGSMVQKVNQLQPAKGKSSPSGIQATSADLVQVGSAIVPAAAHGLKAKDAEVRRLSAQAIELAAAALADLMPSPESQRAPPAAGTRQPLGLAEESIDVQPLTRALGAEGAALNRALGDPDSQVRLIAGRALEDMASARLGILQRLPAALPSGGVAPAPVENQTRRQGDKETGRQVAGVEESQEPPPGRQAREADPLLSGLDKSLPGLSRGLSDPDVRVRLAVLDALEVMGDKAASTAPVVIRAMSDPDTFVRWAAARTLGRMGPVEVVTAVPALARLLSDNDLDVRLIAATVLERYGSRARAALPALERAASVGDAEIRVAALHTLVSLGPESRAAEATMAEQLANPEARVRRAAAEALGRLGPAARQAEPALRRVLDDEDPDVRVAASDALLSILRPAPSKEK